CAASWGSIARRSYRSRGSEKDAIRKAGAPRCQTGRIGSRHGKDGKVTAYIHNYQPLASYLVLVTLSIVVAVLGTVPAVRKSPAVGWLTAVGALVALWLDQKGIDSQPWQAMIRFDGFS